MPRLFHPVFASSEFQQPEAAAAVPAGLPHGPCDDELPLGLECAHPALQIERWSPEAGAPEPACLC